MMVDSRFFRRPMTRGSRTARNDQPRWILFASRSFLTLLEVPRQGRSPTLFTLGQEPQEGA